METKTFLVILGAIITIVVLAGIWFIANSISEQSKVQYDSAMNITLSQFNEQNNQSRSQYEAQINKSNSNFNRSFLIHENLFSNITDIKKGLDPVLATIENATQMRIDQDKHYSIALTHFNELHNMSKTDLKHSKLLESMNETLSQLVNDNNNKNQSTEGLILR